MKRTVGSMILTYLDLEVPYIGQLVEETELIEGPVRC
jgi:hypothetical protein